MILSISLIAEEVFAIGGMPVTNSLLTMWVGIFVVMIVVVVGMRKHALVPTGVQLALEGVYTFFQNLCESVLENKKVAEKALPFIATLFIFVLTANIFELIPGVGTIGFHKGDEKFIPLFRPASADLNMTFALAFISVITVQVVGLKMLGIRYLKRFFNFSNPLHFFVGILELISEFAKIISFSFRLFGNIFAGEVLLTVFLMLIPFFIPVPFYGLELFVAIIQAFVFAMLTLVFIKIAITPHEDAQPSHEGGH